MSAETAQPDFHRIYLDTNALKGQGWPVPSIVLSNLLNLAKWWKINVFLPEPVLQEVEEHWLRSVKDGQAKLRNAKRDLERLAGPIKCDIAIEQTPIEKLLQEYRSKAAQALKEYSIQQSPFTKRTVSEIFGFAAKYLMPFKAGGEGKGFQDVVILLSVLDHLNLFAEPRALFITGDKAFVDLDFNYFVSGFDQKRLRVVDDLETAFKSLWEPYFSETAIKPYRQEVQNAEKATNALIPEVAEFLRTHLTAEMLEGPQLGDTIIEILSVENVKVLSVEVPFPDPPARDRNVEILIKASADCKVLVKRDLAWVYLFLKYESIPPPPKELEEKIYWSGDVKANADIVNTEFKNINLTALATLKV